ncbi:MAG: ABC transporter permease [Synechococcales cyanobacterium]
MTPLLLAQASLTPGVWHQFSEFLAATVRLSVPLIYTALGGLLSERSGVLNIGLEGILLTGAFVSAMVAFLTQNLLLAAVAAVVAGGVVGLLHAFLCVTLRVDQVVSSLAINLSAFGLTSFFSRLIFVSGAANKLPKIDAVPIPGLEHLPLLGPLLFQQDPLVYVLFIVIPLGTYLLFHSHWGLTLRAVGEYPRAADTTGIRVAWVRYIAVTLGGSLASLGGVYLVLVHVRFFTENISAGKGFIALAALIFGKWHPIGASLACLLFGATEALQLRIQAFGVPIPYQFLSMLPYGVALLAVIGLVGKAVAPAALGIPYVKESRGE